MTFATAEHTHTPRRTLLLTLLAIVLAAAAIGGCASAEDACLNTCSRENVDRICNGGQIAICTRFNDGCLHYGQPQACGGNLACVQEGTEPASCQPLTSCTNACQLGSRSCSAEGLFQTCVENGQGCTVFDSGVACPDGERCDGGACIPESTPCENECPSDGNKTCVLGDIRQCGQYDADTCLELSSPVECPSGQFCQNGACITLCSDACSQVGDMRCAASSEAVESCETGSDGCKVWGAATACGSNERCDAGACVEATVPCEDDCASGESRCQDNAVIACGQNDSDECLEFGPPTACAAPEVCDSGACGPAPTPTLLIHELQYDMTGVDTGNPEISVPSIIFLEITGPAGASLDGVSLVDFNGNTGTANAEIDLSGHTIPDDGLFLIAHTNASPALAAEANLLSEDFDPENGNKADAPDADAIQLRFGDTIIDALGYGGGVGNQFGEGTAAEDADVDESLQRTGGDTDDNATDFVVNATPSPGTL